VSKYDFSDTVQKIQNSYGKDERRASQIGLGDSLESISFNPEDYVVMPEWWRLNYGVLGLRFGHFVQIAGESDSGKTSLSILAAKQAQEQGHAVLYAETEGKTSPEELISAGIDLRGIITIHSKITEEVFEGINTSLDALAANHPDAKVLLIIDSYGNTSSMRDSELDLTDKAPQVGGAAKTNRLGVGAIAAKQLQQNIAVLIVNYTYANIGSVGKTNAGGKALDFHCMLTIQSQRRAWYERVAKGEKVRAGAVVNWKIYKNHYAKSLKTEDGNPWLPPKELNIRISANGLETV